MIYSCDRLIVLNGTWFVFTHNWTDILIFLTSKKLKYAVLWLETRNNWITYHIYDSSMCWRASNKNSLTQAFIQVLETPQRLFLEKNWKRKHFKLRSIYVNYKSSVIRLYIFLVYTNKSKSNYMEYHICWNCAANQLKFQRIKNSNKNLINCLTNRRGWMFCSWFCEIWNYEIWYIVKSFRKIGI